MAVAVTILLAGWMATISGAHFLTGRILQGHNELFRLNGVMTPREATWKCESDPHCAGFSFKGPHTTLDRVRFRTTFYSFVGNMGVSSVQFAGWSSYLTERIFLAHLGAVPEGPDNLYVELEAKNVTMGAPAERLCVQTPNCTAIALSRKGGPLRIFQQLHLGSFRKDPDWNTLVSLRSSSDLVIPDRALHDVNFCCRTASPGEGFQVGPGSMDNPIERVPCDLSESDFVQKFVRTRTPVILTGCEGFEWLDEHDLTADSVTKVLLAEIAVASFTLAFTRHTDAS